MPTSVEFFVANNLALRAIQAIIPDDRPTTTDIDGVTPTQVVVMVALRLIRKSAFDQIIAQD